MSNENQAPDTTNTTENNIVKAQAAKAQVLTIHTDGSAEIQERRTALVKKGSITIQAEGVTNNVDKSSIMVAANPQQFTVKTRTVLDPEKQTKERALEEFVGQEITALYTTPFKLQSYNGKFRFQTSNGDLVLDRKHNGNDGTMITIQPEAIVLPGKLKDLRKEPALQIEGVSMADQEIELAVLYRAQRVQSCNVSHNLIYDAKAKKISFFESNALIRNGSGCDWDGVTIKLLTGGDNQRPAAKMARMQTLSYGAYDESAGGGGAPGAASESVGERKLFELPPGISINDGETKLVQLLCANDVPVEREYYLVEGDYEDLPAQVKLSFKNVDCDNKRGLGKPIPAGPVSVYQLDSSGSLQPTATTPRIGDTSIGDSINLELGDTKDIKATRLSEDLPVEAPDKAKKGKTQAIRPAVQTQISGARKRVKKSKITLEKYVVSLKNFKEEAVTVVVPHSLNRDQKQKLRTDLSDVEFKVENGRILTSVELPARVGKDPGTASVTYVIESTNETEEDADE